MKINETILPGLGVRQELALESGRRLCLVGLRDGTTTLCVSSIDDPDAMEISVPLSEKEAATLGSLLGGPELARSLAREQEDLDGVSTHQLTLPKTSRYVGQPLGSTRLRTRTGASVVAVIRDGVTEPSPGPDFVLHAGDRVVVVGTPQGHQMALDILRES
ncbi:cation:proton antiporter regulatory subunit [Devriesea agamarum]|uniref:cation:proton antiporter regulatory subunit n=1 Tax=Devriesea agamarum TaxID=472569 RepID=UPI00071CEED0|nr:TrkA C-terminal domain-containing protein [Devriesea agamarum]